jgi:hypothetical protein
MNKYVLLFFRRGFLLRDNKLPVLSLMEILEYRVLEVIERVHRGLRLAGVQETPTGLRRSEPRHGETEEQSIFTSPRVRPTRLRTARENSIA